MKKAVALFAILFSSLVLSAEDTITRFGVTGGMTSEKMDSFGGRKKGWHAGATCQINFPLYLSLQPYVIFERCGSYVDLGDGGGDLKMNNLKIPVLVQWGPDLGLFRPYIQAGPYVNVLLAANSNTVADVRRFLTSVELGTSLGLGCEIWKFQIAAKYNWAFKTWLDVFSTTISSDKGRGVELSLTFFFN